MPRGRFRPKCCSGPGLTRGGAPMRARSSASFPPAVRVLVGFFLTMAESGKLAKLRRWWLDRDKSRRALAALDDEEVGNLSEIGRQIRREARRARDLR